MNWAIIPKDYVLVCKWGTNSANFYCLGTNLGLLLCWVLYKTTFICCYYLSLLQWVFFVRYEVCGSDSPICLCCAKGSPDNTPISRLRKISKQIQNEGNQKENRQSHQHQGFTWFGNSQRPQVTDDEFTIIKRDYKVGVEASNQTQKPQYTQISLQSSQITNNREFIFPIQVGGFKQIPNTKYQIPKSNTTEISEFPLVKLHR